jgi:Arc/MetJ family transcription regulator
MAKTLIDVDEGLLARSQQILGTATKKETVNGALRELVRRAAAEDFLALAKAGGLRHAADGEVMAQAWR